MKSKVFVLLLAIWTIQLIGSCDDCHCDPVTYDVTYDSLAVFPYQQAGAQSTVIDSIARRDGFALYLKTFYQFKKQKEKKLFSSLGFTSANACDCVEDGYIEKEQIDSLKIRVKNIISQAEYDITDQFEVTDAPKESYDWNKIQWFSEGDYQLFPILNTSNLPDTAQFTVEIYLNSGKHLSAITDTVRFVSN